METQVTSSETEDEDLEDLDMDDATAPVSHLSAPAEIIAPPDVQRNTTAASTMEVTNHNPHDTQQKLPGPQAHEC